MSAVKSLRRRLAKSGKWFCLKPHRAALDAVAQEINDERALLGDIDKLIQLRLKTRVETLVRRFGLPALTPDQRLQFHLLRADAASARAEVLARAESGLHGLSPDELESWMRLCARQDAALAWHIAQSQGVRVPCVAALAQRFESSDEARRQAIHQMATSHPDALLLECNLATSASAKLEGFNRYLQRHGLPLVALESASTAFRIDNIQAERPSGPAQAGPAAPLLSILMAGRNARLHVGFALRSLLAQSHRNLEIVFIDDASEDDTVAIVEQLAAQDDRIRLIRLECQVGTYAAKNEGFAHSLGDFIAFHDADDWSHPDKYRLCLQVLQAQPACMAVTSNYVRITENGQFHSQVLWPLTRWSPNCIVFRRREVLQATGPLDINPFGADSEFVARIRRCFGEAGHHKLDLPLTLALHRADSLTTQAATEAGPTGFSPRRVAYQELWTEWHLRLALKGRKPWLAAGESIADRMATLARGEELNLLPCSRGIAAIPLLEAYFSPRSRIVNADGRPDIALGWGRKASGAVALVTAARTGGQAWLLEDGFLRSFGTGATHPPLSLMVDRAGIYYDNSRPCELENLLNGDSDIIGDLQDDVRRARQAILDARLSKYNHAPDWQGPDSTAGAGATSRRVLVVDQTAGDLSITLGGASASSFAAMLEAARRENPGATVYVKTHPEVSSGQKSGHFGALRDGDGLLVLREAINPLSLIEHMDAVYVVTSTMGFEALLAGRPVVCFGAPWYAGWGVTDDRIVIQRRQRRRTVDELFCAAYIRLTRYLDPISHRRGTIFDVIRWLQLQREMARRWPVHGELPRAAATLVGFRRWKAYNVRPLIGLPPARIGSVTNWQALQRSPPGYGDVVISWGLQAGEDRRAWTQGLGAHFLRMEDGFLRSVGLGSDLIRPHSLVLDRQGIYFDPRQPSDLESILANHVFSAAELDRARRVREDIVRLGLTKYNHEPRQTTAWRTHGRRVVLVPGQVEDDASIRFGCTEVRTNLQLLQSARQAWPDAFIVYKPHPDVISGNRRGTVHHNAAAALADYVESERSVVSCIDASDEVHTMTSLTGFDALLRGKAVHTYGQPFYAGWGLTVDAVKDGAASHRRRRTLTLDELVAGTLLIYPVYWDWQLRGYTQCEGVVQTLARARDELVRTGGLDRLRVGFLRRQWRKLEALIRAELID